MYFSCVLCFCRDIYLLRTSNRFSAWPCRSLTAWPSGRRPIWRRRHVSFRKVSQEASVLCSTKPKNKRNPFEISIYAPLWYPYFPPVKRHATCLTPERNLFPVEPFTMLKQHLETSVCNVLRMFDRQLYRWGWGAAFAWPVLMLLVSMLTNTMAKYRCFWVSYVQLLILCQSWHVYVFCIIRLYITLFCFSHFSLLLSLHCLNFVPSSSHIIVTVTLRQWGNRRLEEQRWE